MPYMHMNTALGLERVGSPTESFHALQQFRNWAVGAQPRRASGGAGGCRRRRAPGMEEAHEFRFGGFRLDLQSAQLWRGTEVIRLRPKSFAVLCYLVAHPDRVVTKDEVLQAVWPDTSVSEAALTVCLNELRHALGETAQAPQCIATVHRRGYRFVAPVTRGTPAAALAPPVPAVLSPPPSLLVGREAVCAQLHGWLAQ